MSEQTFDANDCEPIPGGPCPPPPPAPAGRIAAVAPRVMLRAIRRGEPDPERALVNPGAVFASPDEVVRHPKLTLARKRRILWNWAWDEHLVEVAQGEGMPEGPPSRLDEVRAALRRLGDDWHPHPAAPAAFAIRFERQEAIEAAAGPLRLQPGRSRDRTATLSKTLRRQRGMVAGWRWSAPRYPSTRSMSLPGT
jgi:hypothetical protein